MSSTSIRPFEEADLDGVFSLYRAVFGEESLDRFRRRWRWQFFEHPHAASLPARLRVAELNDRIVGFVAAFPVHQKVLDRELVVRRSCDLMVDPEVRAQDPILAIRLLSTMKHCPGDTIWVGMGYSPKHREMRHVLGHRPLHAIPYYLRPLDMRPIARYLIGENGNRRAWALPPISWLLEGAAAAANTAVTGLNRVRRPRPPEARPVDVATHAGAEFDELWQRASAGFPIIAVRDRRFVQWRFFDDPVFDNTVLLARGPDRTPVGYLAMRVGLKASLRVGRILDIFCAPESTATIEALVHAAFDRFREEGVAVVSCMGLHPSIRRAVRRYLYVVPPGRQNPASVHWKGEPEQGDAVFEADNWHLSHADGDEGFAP